MSFDEDDGHGAGDSDGRTTAATVENILGEQVRRDDRDHLRRRHQHVERK